MDFSEALKLFKQGKKISRRNAKYKGRYFTKSELEGVGDPEWVALLHDPRRSDCGTMVGFAVEDVMANDWFEVKSLTFQELPVDTLFKYKHQDTRDFFIKKDDGQYLRIALDKFDPKDQCYRYGWGNPHTEVIKLELAPERDEREWI